MNEQGMEELHELENAASQEYLSPGDKDQGKSALHSKVSALLQATPTMELPEAASVIKFASYGSSGINETALEGLVATFQKRLIQELQTDPTMGRAKLHDAVRAWRLGEAVFLKWPHLKELGGSGSIGLEEAVQRGVEVEEAVLVKEALIGTLESAARYDEPALLREAIAGAREGGVPAAQIAPFE